jgi:type II secretory pathway component PulJ
LQTVTTVGYGDVAPQQLGGRLVGAVVMLEGTAFIAILTAVITSTFITRATRKNEAMRAKETLSDVERIERRLDALERKLDVLVAAQTREGSTMSQHVGGSEAEGEGFEPSVQGLPTQRFSRESGTGPHAAC